MSSLFAITLWFYHTLSIHINFHLLTPWTLGFLGFGALKPLGFWLLGTLKQGAV